ncbi:MAG TPA: NAD(P)-binding domain-containing protein [Steroidobacteraceae bacterium]|nr:NAD(P)-binding domain-containing protein [Steroidobacteraceae bacterium]
MNESLTAIYAAPLLLTMFWYLRRRIRAEKRSREVFNEAKEAGLLEPVSLHPSIDPVRCLGCAACLRACPEQEHHHVFGLIEGKAHLVAPTECIGHGACKAACPVDAITLVFGTETRGVDLPVLNPSFETNVPGVYIAGELGGMGLIRNALTQGRQAVESIAKQGNRAPGKRLDVLIVGAGPAGMAAALTAKSLNLTYRVIEQESLGGCVFKYPRGKLVMTAPVELPLVGKFHFRQTSKEQLLTVWTEIMEKEQLRIQCSERVEAVEKEDDGFVVRTSKAAYRTSTVLLAIGRRGTPRKLAVPGEELPKVVYRLVDPDQYIGQEVLVVGGGDSALEAAASIAEVSGTQVTLSYRGEAFGRAKPRNRQRVAQAADRGNLKLLLSSNVSHIHPDLVILEHGGKQVEIRNMAVIVSAGGVLPNEFLNKVGVRVETKYGTA